MPAHLALPLLITLAAPPVSPRWDTPAGAATEAAPLEAARATLRPLYALRGLLFLLRAEATGVDPGTKGLTPADIGLFATRLTRPKNDLTRGPGLKQVVAAAWDAAPDAATARTLKATFRRLAEAPRMKAGAAVKASAFDEAARDRVSSLAALVRNAVVDLEAASGAPAAAKALAPVAKKLAAGTTAASLRTPPVSPGSTRPPARWSPVCVRCWTTPPPPTTCAPPSPRSSTPSRPSEVRVAQDASASPDFAPRRAPAASRTSPRPSPPRSPPRSCPARPCRWTRTPFAARSGTRAAPASPPATGPSPTS